MNQPSIGREDGGGGGDGSGITPHEPGSYVTGIERETAFLNFFLHSQRRTNASIPRSWLLPIRKYSYEAAG